MNLFLRMIYEDDLTNALCLVKEGHQLVSPRSVDRHDSVDKASLICAQLTTTQKNYVKRKSAKTSSGRVLSL